MDDLMGLLGRGLKDAFSDPSFLQLLATVLAVFIASLFKKVREVVAGACRNVISGKKTNHHFDARSTKTYDLIGNDLIALRLNMDASRAAVFQFHNGDEFTLSNPIFKVTCSYEKVKNGLTFTSDYIKFSLVTSFMDFIGPLMDASRETPGVSEILCDMQTDDGKPCRVLASPLRILKYSLDDMPYSQFKYVMESQGVSTVYATLLCSKDRNRPLGILCLMYQDDTDRDDLIQESACAICDTTVRVQFLLDAAR